MVVWRRFTGGEKKVTQRNSSGLVRIVVKIRSLNVFTHISLKGLESHECHFKKEGERREGWWTKRERKEREGKQVCVFMCACDVCGWQSDRR